MKTRRHGFTLVELLLVIGIIALLLSLLLPVTMLVRRSARSAVCMSNLRQVGMLYLQYANLNRDRIPLGTSATTTSPGYYTAAHNVTWMGNAPSAAAGPLLLGGMLKRKDCKTLYCPIEAVENIAFDAYAETFDTIADRAAGDTVLTSYTVRPIKAVWIHDTVAGTVEYPQLPKLIKVRKLTLLADEPQRALLNHGSKKSPYIHALTADGSVRQVPQSVFNGPLTEYLKGCPIHRTLPPGYCDETNVYAIQDNDTADTIWQDMDRYLH